MNIYDVWFAFRGAGLIWFLLSCGLALHYQMEGRVDKESGLKALFAPAGVAFLAFIIILNFSCSARIQQEKASQPTEGYAKITEKEWHIIEELRKSK